MSRKYLKDERLFEVPPRRDHPAKFPRGLVAWIGIHVLPEPPALVLDPMAGAGRIYELEEHGYQVAASDLEGPDSWSDVDPRVTQADAKALGYDDSHFDAVVTSPPYANRMASRRPMSNPRWRMDYASRLGRPLVDGSVASMGWGARYKAAMAEVWAEVLRVVKPGGLVVVNVKDHYRRGVYQPVAAWHLRELLSHGCVPVAVYGWPTKGWQGKVWQQAPNSELVLAMRTPPLYRKEQA